MAIIDTSTTALKVLNFCFFGALGCLFPFLPLHMRSAGLSAAEARIVSMVAPAASMLGPLAVGPLADRLAAGLWGQSGSKSGSEKSGELKDFAARSKGHRRLRILLAVLVLLSAVAYCLLLLVVPIVTRRDSRTPQVTFMCDAQGEGRSGGVIAQERCADECHEWGGERVGSLVLTDCHYDCIDEEAEYDAEELTGGETTVEEAGATTTTMNPDDGYKAEESPIEATYDREDGDYEDEMETTTTGDGITEPSPSSAAWSKNGKPPHLCFRGKEARFCHAFSSPESSLAINATISGSSLGTGSDKLCIYPLSSFNLKGQEYDRLSCLPPYMPSNRCNLRCSINQPYDQMNSGPSLLGPSGSCPSLLGDPSLTFWSYLIVRSVADCFPAAAITILDATLLLPSTTSPGKQIAAGALGISVASISVSGLLIAQQNELSYLSSYVYHYLPYPWPPFVAFSVLALIAVVLLLIFPIPVLLGEEARQPKKAYKTANCEVRSSQSPVLYPRRPRPRPRLGPYPPPRLATHAGEAVALFLVLVLLGIFWGGLDSYTSWYLSDLMGSNEDIINSTVISSANETMEEFVQNGWLAPSPPPKMLLLLLGLLMTAAALPAIPLMWHAEKVVEICGHANILILAFTFYIVRYAVFSFVGDGWWCLLSEAISAPMALGIAWATAVHYTHLLCPPRLSATAQAAAVTAHFCIGRCFGAIIGGFTWEEFGLKTFFQGGAIAAAIIASLYFLIYHCCLKTRCVGGTGGLRPGGSGGVAWGGGRGQDSNLEGPTTNGNYTPLRVYHNGQGDRNKDRF